MMVRDETEFISKFVVVFLAQEPKQQKPDQEPFRDDKRMKDSVSKNSHPPRLVHRQLHPLA